LEQLKDFFKDKKVTSILDVGTGTGDFLTVLKDVFRAARFTGIDPNSDALKEAAIKHPEVSFMEMSGETLNFDDSSFDLASISMALHHLPDVKKALNEMKRVVKSGGWMVVNELFSDNLSPAQEVHKMYHHFRSSVDRLIGVSHNHTFKKAEILSLIEKSGIEIIHHFEFNKAKNLISNPRDVEFYVQKMEAMLEPVKNSSEYNRLKPKISEFKEAALNCGFQQATKVVVIGKIQ